MKIQPIGNIIQIKLDEVKAGVLDTSSRASAIEYGEVMAIGDEVKLKLKVGDKVFIKSWALDNISHEGIKYYFICPETNGILAIVK